MQSLLNSQHTEIKEFTSNLEDEKITIPRDILIKFNLNESDVLALIKISQGVLLLPKSLKVPHLIDQFLAIMEQKDVSLNELLNGLEIERETIWQENVNHGRGERPFTPTS